MPKQIKYSSLPGVFIRGLGIISFETPYLVLKRFITKNGIWFAAGWDSFGRIRASFYRTYVHERAQAKFDCGGGGTRLLVCSATKTVNKHSERLNFVFNYIVQKKKKRYLPAHSRSYSQAFRSARIQNAICAYRSKIRSEWYERDRSPSRRTFSGVFFFSFFLTVPSLDTSASRERLGGGRRGETSRRYGGKRLASGVTKRTACVACAGRTESRLPFVARRTVVRFAKLHGGGDR